MAASVQNLLGTLKSLPTTTDSPSDEAKKERVETLLREACLPRRTLAWARSADGEAATARADEWGEVFRNLRADVCKDGVIMGLLGMQGRGKTALAVRLAWEMIRAGRSVRYLTLFDLYELYAAARANDPGKESAFRTERDVTEALIKPRLLIVDECGKGLETESVLLRLGNVLGHRTEGRCDTLLLANLSPEDFALWTGPSLARRINANGGTINFNWGAYA